MNVYELVEAVGGEITNGRARVRIGKEYTVIGLIIDGEMSLTKEGIAMVKERSGEKKAAPKTPKDKSKPETKAQDDVLAELDKELEE